jgi:flagellar biosynthesis/type III secretory pathway chaperone
MQEAQHELEPDRLIQLLEKQRELYLRLRELSDRQRALIAGDRPDQLLSILHDRQALVAALVQLNEELAPYRRNWEVVHAELPDGVRQRASALLEEINELLRNILRVDQEDGALLSARKQAVAQSLSEVSGGRTAHAAYGRQGPARPATTSADTTG